MQNNWRRLGLLCAILVCGAATAPSAVEAAPTVDPVVQTLCALMEQAAEANQVPRVFFIRLIWRESALQTNAVSSAGARGIAQFMPQTARERGLANPFDPEEAIPQSARFLAELAARFGNYGLAAAAYNAGPDRVAAWLAGNGELPLETQDYVLAITGHVAEDWAKSSAPTASAPDAGESCVEIVATLRSAAPEASLGGTPFAPWGVQLAGSFSKSAALAAFGRARAHYGGILGNASPFVLASRLRSRGVRAFFRVRMPAQTRQEAENLCERLQRVGGACVVLRS